MRKKNRSVSIEELEAARVALDVALVEDVFVQFGIPENISGRRARKDYSAYRRAMTLETLSGYSAPTYLLKGLKALKERKKPKRLPMSDVSRIRPRANRVPQLSL